MKDRELFKACVSQCVWCEEQWPLVESRGKLAHVGPFTKDPKLFSRACDASTIRTAFKYSGFKGGKQTKHKARTAAELRRVMEGYYKAGRKGLAMNLDGPGNRSFWRGPIVATIEVASWPAWKRSGGGEPPSPERLKRNRDELLFFDECDFICRQACTDNLQYRPHWDKGRGNLVKPQCNGGFGCMTCWGLYEKAHDEHAATLCY
jgi:hypothetical protein